MGNACYKITRPNGERITAGYGVETVCEEEGCNEQIDRGLAYLCGNEPGGDEYGCGGYYCAHHLYLGSGAPVSEGLCKRCDKRWEEQHQEREELYAETSG